MFDVAPFLPLASMTYILIVQVGAMIMGANFWLLSGALSNALGVILGAFGAHYFKARLASDELITYDVAIRYLFIHAMGLLILGLLAMRVENFALKLAGLFFLLGIVLFSGSLFLIIATKIRAFGAITPFGGLCFTAGWLAVAVSVTKIIKAPPC